MKAEWDELVVVLQQSALPSAYEVDLEAVADDLDDVVGLDAEAIALSAWRMAAMPQHLGECANRDGAADAAYTNPCDECQAQLVEFGSRVIAKLKRADRTSVDSESGGA